MKKIVNRVKKILLMIPVCFFSMRTKVMGDIEPQPLYGINPPESQTETSMIWKIIGWVLIPIAFVVGAIVYLKKSSSSTLRKTITILITLVISVIIWCVINYFIV